MGDVLINTFKRAPWTCEACNT